MSKVYLEDRHFQGETFSGKDLEAGEYEHCSFSNCTFLSADLSGLHFTETSFVDCDLSMAVLKGTAFREVIFKRCKLLGLRFDDCNSFSLSFDFEACLLQYASFFGLKIPKTRFQACKLEEVEFRQADLSNAVFSQCDLKGATFERSNLEGADFETAVNVVLDPELNVIRRARFSSHNVAGLLEKYQIVLTV